MNALNELLDTLHENNITRVLRMSPLDHAKSSPAMVSLQPAMLKRGLGSDEAPFFTFISEHGRPANNMETNLRAALELQVEAVIAPLAGSHFDLEGCEAQISKEESENEGEVPSP